ncbi:aminomethyltransferase family protein [Haloarculaceae archaeon H-GB2-1]|nr:aminomethyltransferase family protein [Haloarculaceae archaeon H-GB1-1]MEA5409510.1 aminomethyltransferase family protein [Haloarculaceae archaeon H-GB2-1]
MTDGTAETSAQLDEQTQTATDPLRRSPMYEHQRSLDAEFAGLGDWKSPNWYGANQDLDAAYDGPEGEDLSLRQAVEHRHVREHVGLYDLTPFTPIEVRGPSADSFLQKRLANDMAIDVGEMRYTTMLNEDGGIQADLTVVRMSDERFLVITLGVATGRQHAAWIREYAPTDVDVVNRGDEYCGVGVWGPKARDVLESVTNADLSNDAFPYYSARELVVDEVPVTALRLSYVGELGWELWTPMGYGAQLWETLAGAAEDHDGIAMGTAALNSMGLEKGFRFWGADITPDRNPYEANLAFTVDMATDFVGKDAIEAARDAGVDERLVPITLDDSRAIPGYDATFLDSDTELGGAVRSDFGYSVDESILYGYLPTDYAEAGTPVDVAVDDERYAATVRDEPRFDPDREKLLR